MEVSEHRFGEPMIHRMSSQRTLGFNDPTIETNEWNSKRNIFLLYVKTLNDTQPDTGLDAGFGPQSGHISGPFAMRGVPASATSIGQVEKETAFGLVGPSC